MFREKWTELIEERGWLQLLKIRTFLMRFQWEKIEKEKERVVIVRISKLLFDIFRDEFSLLFFVSLISSINTLFLNSF